tara:strand:- start:2010 stop:2336 length:327 start_codon:yes stop_codon:yes gene_type:complete
MTSFIKNEAGDQNFWEKHLIQWRETGSSQAEYCRKNNLKEHTFSYQKCKRINKIEPKANASTGFIQLQLPSNKIEPATLTLRFNNGTLLSGITECNLTLVKQLAEVFA